MKLRWLLWMVMSIALLLMAGSQWWLNAHFKENLQRQFGEAAFSVAKQTAESVIFNPAPGVQLQTFKFSIRDGQKTANGSAETNNAIRYNANTESNESGAPAKILSPSVNRDITLHLSDSEIGKNIIFKEGNFSRSLSIPRDNFDASLKQLNKNISLILMALTVFFAIVSFLLLKKLTSPFTKLQIAAGHIGRGDYKTRVNRFSRLQPQETTQLIQSFNQMAISLEQLQLENERLTNIRQIEDYSNVAHSFAHAIRNPLNSINLCLDQLNQEQNDRTIKIAKHEVQQINHWVTELVSTLQGDHQRTETIDINHLIGEILNHHPRQPQINFHSGDDSKNTYVEGNPNELTAIMMNIINNAYEARKDCIIDIDIKSIEDEFCITVSDNGPGFSQSILSALFEPHISDKPSGSGMGLYLARKIIQNYYSGDVIAKNTEKGAMVQIRLMGKHIND